MKKILIVSAIFAVTMIITAVAIVVYVSRDISEPDIADLLINRPDIQEEDNAYTYFNLATNTLYWPDDYSVITDFLQENPADMDELSRIIAENKETLVQVHLGLKQQHCLTPEVTGFDTLITYIIPWRNMGRILAAKCRQQRLAGQHTEASDTCIALLRFADMIHQDSEVIINYLVGISILDIGLKQARDLARDENTPAVELKKLSDALAELGPFTPGFIRAIKAEYKMSANAIDDIAGAGGISKDDMTFLTDLPLLLKGRKKRVPGYLFQPNRTKLIIANHYREIINNAPLRYAEMNLYDFEDLHDLQDNKLKLLTRPNAIGNILLGMLIPALNNFLERKCRTECDVSATYLLTAIQSYKKNNDSMPDTLQDLVPEYIDSVPYDPYDGKPFRYDPHKRIIYSVGSDLKDSEGSTVLLSGSGSDSMQRKRWNSEDAVYEIEKKIQPKDSESAFLSIDDD